MSLAFEITGKCEELGKRLSVSVLHPQLLVRHEIGWQDMELTTLNSCESGNGC